MPQQHGTKKTPKNCFSLSVMGDGFVGKSCCTLRFLYDRFETVHDATIEDFYDTTRVIDSEQAYCDITDSSGQDVYDDLHDVLFRSSDGFVFVFDITNRQSFERVQELHKKLMMINSRKESVPCVFFGNKIDLVEKDSSKRQVSSVENINLAKNLGGLALEGSALTGQGVEDAFFSVVRLIRAERRQMQEKLEQLKKLQKDPLGKKATKKGISTSSKSQALEDLEMFGSRKT
eukprot:CAMPEP_0117440912 /NCGR_PEP_ID=MMETSP0759-20121206/3345_1 /TAXON_ID=63605 /ORGANISM="Percolomonas cosmopolitus, Strain WS" /LENGTH=231 /DNA_ID=CAMNT_0005232713 /DNA_START=18 /DNA_END=713 /DNA_ORIENTATION=-